MKVNKMGKFDKWEVEDGLRSLERAEEVRNNKDLLIQVQKLAKKKIKEISSIAELRELPGKMDEDD